MKERDVSQPVADPFVFVQPKIPIAGGVVIVARKSRLASIANLESVNTKRRYIARAYITDQITLAGDIDDLMNTRVPRLVRIQEPRLSIYLHAGGNNAVFFDLCADSSGYLNHIDVEVEGTFPADVLGPGRTAINGMLDKLVGWAWTPLSIGRLELYLKSETEPLVHQFLMPFTDQEISLQPFGGMNDIPIFGAYESLIREAVNSTSPFYRFLCAYRLYEGIGELRKSIREIRDKVGVTVKLPSDPPVDVETLKNLGASPSFLGGLKTVSDLHAKLTDSRNQLAHFLLKGARFVVSTSNGIFYSDYAMTGAILLQYGHKCLVELRRFCADHLDGKVRLGEVLPLLENRDQFVVKTI